MTETPEPRWASLAADLDVDPTTLREIVTVGVASRRVSVLAGPNGLLCTAMTGRGSESFGVLDDDTAWSASRVWGSGGFTAAAGRLPSAQATIELVGGVGDAEHEFAVSEGCWALGVAAFDAESRLVVRAEDGKEGHLRLPEPSPLPDNVRRNRV